MIVRSAKRFLWKPVSKESLSTFQTESKLTRALGAIKTRMRMKMIWMEIKSQIKNIKSRKNSRVCT